MAGWLTAVRSSFSLGPEGCRGDQASGEVGWVDGSGESRCVPGSTAHDYAWQQQPPQQCPTYGSRRSTHSGSSGSSGSGSAHPQRRRPAGRSPGCRRRAQTAAWRRARPQPPPWPCPRSGGGERTNADGQSAGKRMGCSSCWGSSSCVELRSRKKWQKAGDGMQIVKCHDMNTQRQPHALLPATPPFLPTCAPWPGKKKATLGL